MCRIPPSQPSVRPEARRRPLAGHQVSSGQHREAAGLLRELAYVYHLTARVRQEMAAAEVPLRTKPVPVL